MNAKSAERSEPVRTVPYISFRTLFNLIEKLASTGMPPQIDRSFLTQSEGGKTQILQALRSLELIDQSGAVTDKLTAIVNADADRPKLVGDMLRARYPELVQLGGNNATQTQLEEVLKREGVSGDTLRKAAGFYLKAAEYAGVKVSPHWKTPSVGRGVAGKPRVRRQQGDPHVGDGNTTRPENRGGLTQLPVHPALAGILSRST